MKKTLSLILSSFMLASGLASCAPAKDRLDSAITLASSAAMTKAQWLDARLDEIPNDVVMGIGSSEAYGIDMSHFEDDGYIMREMGDDMLIFGKTEAGLDTAVRKYAKAAQNGQTDGIDETYHEGYRIESLSIAGNDISTYAVVYDGGNASVANEVVRLIQKACGVQLAIGPADAKPEAEHYFYINWIDKNDTSMMELGCRYRVENGDVYIEGRYDQGVANGIYLFLQDHCGWEDLMFGDSVLLEADHIDVPADAAADYPMMFDYNRPFCAVRYGSAGYKNDRAYQQIGRIPVACHGLAAHQWTGNNHNFGQICYMYEDNFTFALDKIWLYIESKQNAGVTVDYIDISQGDAFGYCGCDVCREVYLEEGRSWAGSVIRYANKLSEALAPDYPDVKYLVFAYHGSNNPCKTVPNEHVYITFCTDGHCAVHSINSGECYSESFDQMNTIEPADGIINNADYAEWIKGWCDMSDNVYIWYYALDNNLHQYVTIDQIYDDMQFFKECGVRGVFYQQEITGLGSSRVQVQLINMLNINPDMTKEEYYAQVDRLLEKEYGDGWVYVQEYLNLLEEAEYRSEACYNCWNYADKQFGNMGDSNSMYVNREYYIEKFDRMTELLETAIPMANTADQERHCELLTVSMYYVGCALEYFDVYDNDDSARMEILRERYSLMIERLKGHGYNISDIIGQDNTRYVIGEDVDTEAWVSWFVYRQYYGASAVEDQKPMPDEWVQYWETAEVE